MWPPMPDLLGWARNLAKPALLNLAIGETAKLFAAFIDDEEITPEDLEQLIADDAPVFRVALSQAKATDIAIVRRTFGSVAADLCRSQRNPDGSSWHPYKAILQEDVMGKAHAAHVRILERHQRWYKAQMDAALAWLFGTPPA